MSSCSGTWELKGLDFPEPFGFLFLIGSDWSLWQFQQEVIPTRSDPTHEGLLNVFICFYVGGLNSMKQEPPDDPVLWISMKTTFWRFLFVMSERPVSCSLYQNLSHTSPHRTLPQNRTWGPSGPRQSIPAAFTWAALNLHWIVFGPWPDQNLPQNFTQVRVEQ